MKKKIKFKSPLADSFVFFTCTFVALFFAMLFWEDLNRTSKRNDREVIATISFKKRTAQRKFDDRVVWERITQNSPLYNGDMIRTADLAEAVVTFNEGTVLNLTENTMLQIYFSDEKGLEVSMSGGEVQVDTAATSKANITFTDGTEIKVSEGSALSAKTEDDGKKNIEVKNGGAFFSKPEGGTELLYAGESAGITKEGTAVRNPVTVTSVPSVLQLLNTKNSPLPVKLEWKKEPSVPERIVVQTSRTKDFAVIDSERFFEKASSAVVQLEEGVLWWRIFAEKQLDKAVSGKITVEKALPPTPAFPLEKSTLEFRSEPDVTLRWNGNSFADRYRILVSRSPDMKNPVVQGETQAESISFASLSEGEYWWSVAPYYELHSMGWADAGAISSFVLKKTRELKAPQLASPFDGAKIVYKESPAVSFLWKSDVEDASYTLEVSKNAEFNDILYSKRTTERRASEAFAPDTAGTFYWRVRRDYGGEDKNPLSEVRRFTLSKYVPGQNKLLYPPESFAAEQQKIASVSFMWKRAEEESDSVSVIQVSRKKDFCETEFESLCEGESFSGMTLGEGAWWWRAGVRRSDGTESFAEPRLLTVLKELEKPELLFPAQNGSVASWNGSKIPVAWKKVSGADVYNVRIFDADDVLVSELPEEKGSSALFALPLGSYKCRIQAVSAETDSSPLRTSASVAGAFTVRPPDAVRLVLPEEKKTVDGLYALRSPLAFSWNDGRDKAERYEFILKNRATGKIVERVPTAKNTVSLKRLPAGEYTYSVRAATAEGFPLDSAERNFTITAVPLLARPAQREPRNKLVMDTAYLRANRTILFEWLPVQGASDYSFSLYKVEKDGSRRQIAQQTQKETRWRLKKLSLLEQGAFEWEVTAFCHAKDGFEEQHSERARATFTIDFAPPKKIELVNPGRMYSE